MSVIARNGSGTFTRLYDFTADRDSGSPLNVISADRVDGEFDDISTALTASIAKDGQTTPTADLPMGGFKHTSVATTVSARAQYTPVAVFQDGGPVFIAAAGTDTITATYSPAIPALVNGAELRFRAAAANATTTPTFAPNGLTAKTIVKGANAALVAGDIAGQHHECVVRYNSTTDKWHLLNPITTSDTSLNLLATDATGGAVGDFIPFVDISESNAGNKVLTTDLFKNVLANFTTKTAPVLADTVMVADSAESGAAKISTLQQTFNAMNTLTVKGTPTTSDQVPINDAAASGVAKYTTIGNIQTVLSAVQADLETPTSNVLFVTPGRQHFHPGTAKARVQYDQSSGTATAQGTSYGLSSLTDGATGLATLNYTTSFSTAFYHIGGINQRSATNNDTNIVLNHAGANTPTASATVVATTTASAPSNEDCKWVSLIVLGDL